MRIFNPQMFTLAKEAKGLTQGAIAHHAGVSQSLLSKIENGLEDEPPADLLEKAAELCEVPVAFFFQQDVVLGESVVDLFHRRRKTLPAKPLRLANASANVARMQATRLMKGIVTEDLIDLAPFPALPIDTYGSPQDIAQIVRASWRLPVGPVRDLVALVEQTGIPVFVESLGHEKLAAMSMPGRDASAQVILLNADLPASAQRFSLAHEIGHLVMHTGVATAEMEAEANQFAAELLMPAETIRKQLHLVQFRDLGQLKAIWHVSLAALIYRAREIGEITDRHARTLFMGLHKLPGGRRREPGEFPPERPTLMRKIVSHYMTALGYSVPELAALVVSDERVFRSRYVGEDGPRLRLVGGAT